MGSVGDGGLVASGQEEGIVGRLVGGMIRRSVRKSFRNVYWDGALDQAFDRPVIWVCNHHGWFDGYLMFHVVTKLGVRSLDWIQEFDSFPLFAKVGGMPFPAGDAAARAKTMRETVRLMKGEGRSLVLFAEGVLHRPPEVLPFGRSLGFVAKHVPEALVVPVAIKYEQSLHEKPEAFIRIGASMGSGVEAAGLAEAEVRRLLAGLDADVRDGKEFEVLAAGTPSVNERWDMRKIPGGQK